MPTKKTYGKMHLDTASNKWVITQLEPHVCIKLKQNFPNIRQTDTVPFELDFRPVVCADLHWFVSRYALDISTQDYNHLCDQKDEYEKLVDEMSAILLPNSKFEKLELQNGNKARDYQQSAYELLKRTRQLLLGDEMGVGKTVTGLLPLTDLQNLPALFVVPVHMFVHWKGKLKEFLGIEAHVIKSTKPYELPECQAYITSYTRLAGWVDYFQTGFFKYVCFDEVQDLRCGGTSKGAAAKVLVQHTHMAMGMSGTPIYNYGDELFTILNLLKPRCLGTWDEFNREWCTPSGSKVHVKDPAALGTYLRDNFLFLRRTRADIGKELPPVNKLVYEVAYDDEEVKKSESLARDLAMKVVSGTFVERGMAARDLDIFLRHSTGVAKAKSVAAFVRMILESEESVILFGWHRDVYEIWMRELSGFNPVLYTGSETPAQKQASLNRFINKETKLMIMSLRSGTGIDGLQHVCKHIIIGELDYTPKVHDQIIARVDREGQQEEVTAIFLTCLYGSDPVIMDILGLKASQHHNIMDPLKAVDEQYTDESRIKMMAERFLKAMETQTSIA